MIRLLGIFLLVLNCFDGMGKNPPGTLKVKGTSYYLDAIEMSNLEWYSYVIDMRSKYGKDSEQYRTSLPDSATWCSTYSADEFFKYGKYNDYPVVGITYEQANQYCTWRSELVSLKYGKSVVYTLPSKEVIEMACKQSTSSYKEGVYQLGKRNKIRGLYDNVYELTVENGMLLSSNTSGECSFQPVNEVPPGLIGIRFMARIEE
ncbi:MAG TPA: SUMF1/EgtB/PvdO family nonheme iron enzyme [Flavobacteriales bacterium]